MKRKMSRFAIYFAGVGTVVVALSAGFAGAMLLVHHAGAPKDQAAAFARRDAARATDSKTIEVTTTQPATPVPGAAPAPATPPDATARTDNAGPTFSQSVAVPVAVPPPPAASVTATAPVTPLPPAAPPTTVAIAPAPVPETNQATAPAAPVTAAEPEQPRAGDAPSATSATAPAATPEPTVTAKPPAAPREAVREAKPRSKEARDEKPKRSRQAVREKSTIVERETRVIDDDEDLPPVVERRRGPEIPIIGGIFRGFSSD